MGFHAFNWFSCIHISKCNLLLSVQTYTLYIEYYLKLNNFLLLILISPVFLAYKEIYLLNKRKFTYIETVLKIGIALELTNTKFLVKQTT